MADRLSLIMQLGALATSAAQRGDDRAAQTLTDAAELLFADKSAVDLVEERRRRDRDRKPKKDRVVGNPRKSMESAEIQSAPSGFSPTPPFPNPLTQQHNTAREERSTDMVETYSKLLCGAMGDDLFADAISFARRRPFDTWQAWFREMLSLIGPGSQYVAGDLAQVCRDDAALDRPIASPKGMRVFLASARQERISAGSATPSPSSDHADAQRLVATIRAAIAVSQAPAQAPVRYIPSSAVDALGVTVARAYREVGGAERFLTVTGDKLSFLVRDFAAALKQRTQATEAA
jgi:hypothetical protein